MYRSLSDKYDERYQAHLEAFHRRTTETFTDTAACTDFYPCIGVPANDDVALLVFGQAVGGWQEPLDYTRPVPKYRVQTSRNFSNQAYGTDNPMDWVNVQWSRGEAAKLAKEQREHYSKWYGSYWTHHSFFWQVITGFVAQHVGLADSDWAWNRYVVWSNLYKISPQGINPDEGLRALQRPDCIDLVRIELEELRPKVCLVLTNDEWWRPFRRGLNTTAIMGANGGMVESLERYGDTSIIVTKRPRVGSWRAAVRDIRAALNPQEA